MGETPLLEVRHLDKKYDNGFHADKDISFTLPSGLLVGLIGPNGCGKKAARSSVTRPMWPTAPP